MRLRSWILYGCLAATLALLTGMARTGACTGAPRVAVLTYHDVSPNPQTPFTVTPARLEEDLRWFLGQGWRPLTLAQFRDWVEGRRKLACASFLLTFDDGYAGFADHAVPVLKRLRVPATAFLITGRLGATPADKEIPKLSPDQVTALARSGLVSFGSHTHDLHREVGRVGARLPVVYHLSPQEVRADLARSAERIAQLTGAAPVALAWPYGRAPAWAQAVAQERYPLIFVDGDGFAVQGRPQAIPRFAMEWRTRRHLEQQFGRRHASAAPPGFR